jgi:hypothetical protein
VHGKERNSKGLLTMGLLRIMLFLVLGVLAILVVLGTTIGGMFLALLLDWRLWAIALVIFLVIWFFDGRDKHRE